MSILETFWILFHRVWYLGWLSDFFLFQWDGIRILILAPFALHSHLEIENISILGYLYYTYLRIRRKQKKFAHTNFEFPKEDSHAVCYFLSWPIFLYKASEVVHIAIWICTSREVTWKMNKHLTYHSRLKSEKSAI